MPEELRIMPRPSRQPSPTLRDFVAVFFRQERLVLSFFFGIALAAILYQLLAPGYQAEMKVLVRRGRVDPALTPMPTQPQFEREEVSEEELNSEVELLHDQEMLRTVVKTSGLSAAPSWFGQITGESEDERTARAVRRLDRRLIVEPVRKTTLITVTYESSNPGQAAHVLKCLSAAYLERHMRVLRPAGESSFFEQQIVQSRRGLEDAESRLLTFSQNEGVVSATQERDIALQKLGEAEAADRENQITIAETQQRVRALGVKLKSLPERATTVIRNSDNPQSLGNMKSKLLELKIQRTQLLTRFEPTYRLVQEVDQQIVETRALLAAEELAPLRDQTTDLEPNYAWAKEQLIRAEVQLNALQARARATSVVLANYREGTRLLGQRAVKQEELMNGMKAAEQEYLLYLSKREEARIGDALDQERILNVVIAEQPTVPALPARSALSFGLLSALFAGMASTAIGFAADRLNPAFRTPDEVAGYLGAPVLASLARRGN
jgi:uncharacterized protein involved in exopolysaccharide biosynthesis